MKVTAIQFVPLGRPPRVGECFTLCGDSYYTCTKEDVERIERGEYLSLPVVLNLAFESQLAGKSPPHELTFGLAAVRRAT